MTRGSATRPPDSIDASRTVMGGAELEVETQEGAMPDVIGRFQPLEILGSGAMGIVFAAYDPKLDRRVAIKVVRRRKGGEAAQARLLREAQALAKLSHENVVQVYDVGTLGDGVYIAMEFVEGSDLRRWLETPRKPEEILSIFRRAGAGLAAAHDVGLIHRDFKPANVLLGNDGRVKVADFGLVRPSEASDSPTESVQTLEVDASPSEAFSVQLTGDGAMLGTPAYMSPEQFKHYPATAYSDQFSFSSALWEGLFGSLPHPQRNMADLAAAVIDGARAPMPASPTLSARVRNAVERSLRVDPLARFPDMHALLEALAPEPVPARGRWWVVGALGLAVVGIAAAELSRNQASVGMCEGGADRVAEVYAPDRKKRIEAQFAAAGVGFAADTWTRLESRLDAHATQWADAYDRACGATHLQHEQSEAALDLRMGCLRRSLGELDGLMTALEVADPEMVEHALSAADAMSDLARCDDAPTLGGGVPLPSDTTERARIEAADDLLEGAQAYYNLGQWEQGLGACALAATTLGELSYPPTRVRLERLLANGFAESSRVEDARWHGERAFNLALREQLFTELVRISIALVRVNDETRAHAETWASIGDAAAELAGRDSALEARRLLAVSEFRADMGQYDLSRAMMDEALRLAQAHGTASDQADAMSYQAMMSARMGEHDRGLATAHALQTLVSEHFGPRHPQSAESERTLAEVLAGMHRWEESRAHFEKALEIHEENFGPNHRRVLSLTESIAVSLDESGRTAEARPYFADQVARLEATETSSRHLATSLNSLCFVDYKLGDYAGAMESCERARTMFSSTAGKDSPGYAVVLSNMGLILRAQDDPSAALAVDEQALEIYEALFGPDHLMTSYGLLGIAQSHVAAGAPGKAIAPAERVLALREALKSLDPGLIAEAQVALGQALWSTDQPKAQALLTEAGTTWAAAGPAWERARSELGKWREANPVPD